jgi:hypothetical protein
MTDPKQLERWRGLAALANDLVEHGSAAVERVHMRTAERPFRILEQIPAVAVPARVVHVVHDVTVTSVYATIRIANRVLRASIGAGLELERRRRGESPGKPRSDRLPR